jgi:uncharacterized protein
MHAFASIDAAGSDGQTVLVPDVLPIFPLARTVLLPGEVLPLHIFEPRYRDMVRDAIATHRVIGMVRILSDQELPEEGTPEVEPVGCVGLIAHHQRLDDGRYLIWLVGIERFRIEEELSSPYAYRQVRVAYMPLEETSEDVAGVQPMRRDLKTTLPGLVEADEATRLEVARQISDVSDTQLLALACHVLDMQSEEKQQVLEASSLMERFLKVYDVLYRSRADLDELGEVDPSQLN